MPFDYLEIERELEERNERNAATPVTTPIVKTNEPVKLPEHIIVDKKTGNFAMDLDKLMPQPPQPQQNDEPQKETEKE